MKNCVREREKRTDIETGREIQRKKDITRKRKRERQFIDAKKRFPSKSIETPTTSVKK